MAKIHIFGWKNQPRFWYINLLRGCCSVDNITNSRGGYGLLGNRSEMDSVSLWRAHDVRCNMKGNRKEQ